jgi:hypothetical protein
MADQRGQLRGIGAGNQRGDADQVEKLFLGQPAAALDHLVFHHGGMRRRAAEADRAQLEEQLCQFQVALDHGAVRSPNWTSPDT